MTFPVMIPLGPWPVHPHLLFEALAYALGFRLHLWLRRRAGDTLSSEQRMMLVAAAAVGAAVGSKLLALASDPSAWLGGKSIVGGLIGGLAAVEWLKARLAIVRRTGDLFAIPIAAGMMIGRVGCFLTGLSDRTHGLPTQLPWGVDFGDGIPRHPAQLYEIVWLGLLTAWLAFQGRRPHAEGALFREFMAGYMGFRFLVEFLKPGLPLAGLTAIQWASLGVLVYYGSRHG